nr:serine/threonine-protein phosphatase [Actinomycetota bacterium]NIS32818.1 serine/threonine-protein phosphatase [Actinomycetota bacterium]NIT96479.1 serine/threonine-protein phosphatase [Actinomycetota bacterium]NIU20176.1 serine/threonine-protein phosphatase [Actinomycetota bacterium]NIU67795.1 serine/threonine-protein phosphatase [Actinomycetota bacterium]
MGTTVVALVDMPVGEKTRLGVVNVGDSRLYLRGEDELIQLTEDHSLVETLVRDGRLSREDAAAHPQRNILTRALGIDEMVLVDAWTLTPVAGDRYVLCSDGLFNEVEPSRILKTLQKVDDPTEAAEELVRAAVKAGGRDNVTVLVVDVTATDQEVTEPPANRVIGTFKAVPDAVLHVDHALADAHRGSSDPHPDEIEVDRSGGRRRAVTWRLALFVGAVLLVLAILLVSLVAYAR